MRRAALIAALALLLAATALSATPVTRAQSLAHGDTTGALRDSVAPVRINRPLQGIVLTWEGGRLVRLAGAHIGTGETALQADATGRFSIPASIRTDRLNVVAPGYAVVRRTTTADYAVVLMRPLAEVRAIYVPYAQLDRPEVLDWVLGLARSRVITSVVLDMKDDSGQVHPLFATDLARQAGSVKPLPTDIDGFLRDLDALSIYTIARVVTFRDSLFGRANPADAILTHGGEVMRDIQGLVWTNPFSETGAPLQRGESRPRSPSGSTKCSSTTCASPPTRTSRCVPRPRARSGRRSSGGSWRRRRRRRRSTRRALRSRLTPLGKPRSSSTTTESGRSWSSWRRSWTTTRRWSTRAPGPRGGLACRTRPPTHTAWCWKACAPPWSECRRWETSSCDPGCKTSTTTKSRVCRTVLAEVRLQIEAAAEAGGQGFMLWDPSLQYQLGVLAELAP